MKRKSLLILLPIAAMAFAGCTPVAKPCSEAKITIPDGKQLVNIKKGENAVLEYQISDDNCKKEIAWSTSNPAIATVSNGVVTGVGVGTATIKANDGVSWTVVVTDLPKPVAALDSIAVLSAKADYKVGEFFDKANATVVANYSDGTSKQVTTFSVDKNDALTVDDKVVVFSYTEDAVTKTVNFQINVTSDPSPVVTLTKIVVTKQPTKVDYLVGEEFDPAGLEVTAYYSDGDPKVVNDNLSFDKTVLALEDTKVVVTYTEGVSSQSADIDVNVTSPSEVTLVRIEITKQPTIKEYFVGDTFSSAGLEVTAYYSNSTSNVVDATCSSPDMSTKGSKDVTVSYTEGAVTKEAHFTILVKERTVTTITPQEAMELMDAAGDGKVVEGLQQVKGICASGSKYDSQYSQYTTGFEGVENFKLQFKDTNNILNGDSPDGMEIVVEGYLEKYEGKYQLSYLPANVSPTGEKFTPNLISAQPVQHEGVLDGISVSNLHREFYVGAAFVKETVTAHYSDGTTANVTSSATFDGYNMSTKGEQTVVVSYTEGDNTETTSYTITVSERTVTTITPQEAIELMDAAGDGKVVEGLQQVKGICASGSQYDSQYKQYTTGFDGVSNFKLQFTDTNNILNGGSPDGMEIVVEGYLEKYQGKYQLSYLPANVSPTGQKFTPSLISASKEGQKELTNLVVKTQPNKVDYNEGETFNPAGMVLTATYSDGSTQDITTGWTISPNRALTRDDKIVTVSFGGKSVTIAISVTARELISISITSGMSKTKYYVGDSWSSSGVVVTGTYNIGDPAVIDSSKYSLTYDPTAPALGVSEVSIVASMNDGSMASQAYNQSGIVVEEKQQGASYNLVKSNDDITEGQYLIVHDTKSYKGVDAGMNYATVSVENESIADDESLIYVEFEEMTGGFALKVVGGDNDGKYMYGSESKNTIGFDANKKLNTVSVDDSGNATIVSEKATFKFNTISGETNDRFRYYKPSTTPNTDQVLPSLYKKEGSPAPKKQISGVEIQGTLAKSSYVAGQTFDPTGLSLKVSYDDGTDETVTSGFTFDAANPLAVGEFDIKATYKGCESSNSVHISVVARAITALEIKSGMSKISYVLGEDWAPAGIVVEATYNDGSKANLQSGDYTLEFDPIKPALGVEEVSIVAKAANGITSAAFVQNVSVTEEPAEVTLTGIAASDYTNTATVGQTYTFDGTVTASYSDGSSHAVTGYTWTTSIDTSSAGEKTGVISYTEDDVTKTCNVIVTVSAPAPVVSSMKEGYEAAAKLASGSATTSSYTFSGVVTGKRTNSSTSVEYMVQDGDYAIDVYNPSNKTPFVVGNTVTITSTLQNYNGLIETKSISSITAGGTASAATPVDINSLASLNALKTSVLIKGAGTVVSKPSYDSTKDLTMKIQVGSNQISVFFKKGFIATFETFIKSLEAGDAITINNAVVGCYSGTNQFTIIDETVLAKGPAKEVVSLGQVTAPASIGKGGTLNPSDVTVAVTYDDTTTGSVHPDRIVLDTSTVAESVIGTVYVGDLSTTFTIAVTEKPVSTETTITKAIKDISGTTSDGTKVSNMTMDAVISLVASGSENTGKVYGSGAEWRLYHADGGTMTVNAASGYTIVSIAITYSNGNSGYLTYNSSKVGSGDTVSINGSSACFNADGGQTGKTNGQVKITSITVVYKAN